MKFISEKSWKEKEEEISVGVNRKDSCTDKTQTQKLSDSLDAAQPVEKCVVCTLN